MKLRTFFCVILCVVPASLFAATAEFTRTLHSGMRGEDVRAMQKMLNADPGTRIALSGIGSLGNESDYFGPATKRALIKFQEKYSAEILAPLGLVSGTGIFGANTRAKAVALLNVVSVPKGAATTQAPASTPTQKTEEQKGEVFVMFPSQYSGKAGATITISGAGFTKTDNTIYFGDWHAVEKASSWNGQEITFKIPAIPKGIYSLFIKNARGESNKDQFFVVTDGVTPEPKIESLNPARVARGGAVTIKGTGFLAIGNTLRTGIKIIENISSADGMSLSFIVPLDTLVAATSPSSKKISIPIWVYLVNENGVSNGKSFDLEL
ncbi:MAG: IPT/TIG domain-containing protein [Candidatus Yonathbacteria bacterium]|nr:IPT/TIG domain-containing protein [Candidatus Yonathbacteria bacterium]